MNRGLSDVVSEEPHPKQEPQPQANTWKDIETLLALLATLRMWIHVFPLKIRTGVSNSTSTQLHSGPKLGQTHRPTITLIEKKIFRHCTTVNLFRWT